METLEAGCMSFVGFSVYLDPARSAGIERGLEKVGVTGGREVPISKMTASGRMPVIESKRVGFQFWQLWQLRRFWQFFWFAFIRVNSRLKGFLIFPKNLCVLCALCGKGFGFDVHLFRFSPCLRGEILSFAAKSAKLAAIILSMVSLCELHQLSSA